jgi:hypothetical protein
MKKSLFIGSVLFAVYAGSAFAGDLPPGSYTQTCTNASLQGETLTANCKRFDGSTKNTELPFATSCLGIISNIDGNLGCSAPTGSFARTCKNARVEGHTLFASCQRIDGSWKDSSTTFSGFQHPVTNCNGNLVDKPNC